MGIPAVHWEERGAPVHVWDTPALLFSADVHTCKTFDEVGAVEYTHRALGATRIVAKAF